MFSNFEAWKLHTPLDYIQFLGIVAVFVFITYLMIKHVNNGRNHEAAVKRVGKKLKKPKNGKVYNDAVFEVAGEKLHFDHLLVDEAGIVVASSIGWGIKIYGSRDSDEWKTEDNKIKNVMIPNPVKELESRFETLRRLLSQGGVYGVEVLPLVVFADPFAAVELYLGRDSACINYDQIKEWRKQRLLRAANKAEKTDYKAVIEALDKAQVKPE